jgi:hypothetical protein
MCVLVFKVWLHVTFCYIHRTNQQPHLRTPFHKILRQDIVTSSTSPLPPPHFLLVVV